MLNSGCSSNLTNSYNTNTTGSNRSGKLRRTDQESVNSERHHQQYSQSMLLGKNKRTTSSSGVAGGTSSSTSQGPQRRDSKDEGNRKLRDSFSECRRSTSGYDTEVTENWVEVGSTSLGPILLEGASALPIPDHKLHLVQHK